MEVIFVLGASQAFFLSFLVLNKVGKSHGDYVLAAWLAFMGLHLLDYYFSSTGIALQYPHLLGIGVCFPMLQGPFMFVYILVMISRNGKIKAIHLLHGLPFLLLVIYFVFDFYLLPAGEKLAYYKFLVANGSPALNITSLLNSFLGPVYVVWSLIALRKHIKNISNRFSYTEDIDLKWLKYVLVGLGFVWVTVLLSNLLDAFSANETMGNNLIYLSVTIAIFFLGYFGIKQKAIYRQYPSIQTSTTTHHEISVETKPLTRYKHSGLKEEDAVNHLEALLDYMKNERPYLNGKLSLKGVAEYLDISINHLSQVINERLGKSFFDFVNEYRVEEVKRLLSEAKHEEFTLLAVAYESGFNSKSSFNSIFKKITSVTPSEYIKTMAA